MTCLDLSTQFFLVLLLAHRAVCPRLPDARSMRADPDTETNERNAPFVLRERTTTSDSRARSAQAMHIALSAISGALLGEDTCGRVRWNEP